jgi:hypothetical protein
MFLVTANKPRRLLHLSFIGHVSVKELQQGGNDMVALLADMPAGLRVLGDLERLQSMSEGCVEQIGKNMELLDRHGVELVVRVVPDPSKDIGFNILMAFHYRNRPRVVTCETIAEASGLLLL